MAEIILSDFLAFVFSEVSRARDMADRHSKEIALIYAKDDVLRHFSVPRFKLAKLELNMPVLVSNVEVSSLAHFQMPREAFRSLISSKLIDVTGLVRTAKTGPIAIPLVDSGKPVRTEGLEPMIDAFYDALVSLLDPSKAETVVTDNWSQITAKTLALNELPAEIVRLKPVTDIINRPVPSLIETVKGAMSVPKAAIEKLLINAQTNVVKDGSTDTSVFTIKAEMIEEGVVVKSVKDERTGVESSVVEFE